MHLASARILTSREWRRQDGSIAFYCTFKTEFSTDTQLSNGSVLSQRAINVQVLQSYEKDACGGRDGHSVSTGDGGGLLPPVLSGANVPGVQMGRPCHFP